MIQASCAGPCGPVSLHISLRGRCAETRRAERTWVVSAAQRRHVAARNGGRHPTEPKVRVRILSGALADVGGLRRPVLACGSRSRWPVGHRISHPATHLRLSADRVRPERAAPPALDRPPFTRFTLETYGHLIDGDVGRALDLGTELPSTERRSTAGGEGDLSRAMAGWRGKPTPRPLPPPSRCPPGAV
jgi:hypothetical protein